MCTNEDKLNFVGFDGCLKKRKTKRKKEMKIFCVGACQHHPYVKGPTTFINSLLNTFLFTVLKLAAGKIKNICH